MFIGLPKVDLDYKVYSCTFQNIPSSCYEILVIVYKDQVEDKTLVISDLSYLLDDIYFRFCTKLYRKIVGIPMCTNCAPLVADFVLYCYEKDSVDFLNHDNKADVIEAFN